jgi:hypothetical protein
MHEAPSGEKPDVLPGQTLTAYRLLPTSLPTISPSPLDTARTLWHNSPRLVPPGAPSVAAATLKPTHKAIADYFAAL